MRPTERRQQRTLWSSLQDAAEYVRLNVMPRPGLRRSSVDPTTSSAQEVERGAAQAIEETAAVAAEGRGRRCRQGRGRGLWDVGCQLESAQRRRLGWPLGLQAQPTVSRAARAACWTTRSSGLSRAMRTAPEADWAPSPRKKTRRRHHHPTPKLTQIIPPSQPRKLTRLHSPQNTTPKLTRPHPPFTAPEADSPPSPRKKNRRRHHHPTPKLTQIIPPSQPRKLTGPLPPGKKDTTPPPNSKADSPFLAEPAS